jgi:A/G-specific adenine glycosylase
VPPDALRSALLAWYDAHARDLPWRVAPSARAAGVRPDPYRVWLSEVMLQQTTVPHATPYFLKFTARWPAVTDLAAAADAEVMAAWAGLGYYARARNLLACARAVANDHGGVFPDTEAGLRGLPGLGPYTAAAVAAIAFDRPANVVDGNVERVMARLFALDTPLPEAKPELKRLAAGLVREDRPGDWAQALMDLGAVICRPWAPLCDRCPVAGHCAALARGDADSDEFDDLVEQLVLQLRKHTSFEEQVLLAFRDAVPDGERTKLGRKFRSAEGRTAAMDKLRDAAADRPAAREGKES